MGLCSNCETIRLMSLEQIHASNSFNRGIDHMGNELELWALSDRANGIVKLSIGNRPFGHVCQIGRFFQSIHAQLKYWSLLLGDSGGCESTRHSLHRLNREIGILNVVDRYLSNDRPSRRDIGNQAFASKSLQHLSDRRPARAQPFGEIGFLQALTRLEREVDDGLPNFPIGP